jgi:hypothetical protein
MGDTTEAGGSLFVASLDRRFRLPFAQLGVQFFANASRSMSFSFFSLALRVPHGLPRSA